MYGIFGKNASGYEEKYAAVVWNKLKSKQKYLKFLVPKTEHD